MEYYAIDPSHMYTGSRLTLDAAFFFGRVQVEVGKCDRIKDIVERGLREGVVLLSESFVKANTKRFGTFDPALPTLNILSLDING